MAISRTIFAAFATLALAACAAPANNAGMQGGCPCMQQQQGSCGGAGKPCPMMQGQQPGMMPCPMMQKMQQQGQPAPMPPMDGMNK